MSKRPGECLAPSGVVCPLPLRVLVEPKLSYSSQVEAMKIISCSLRKALRVDFSRACAQLAEARLRQDEKDTSGNRAAVAECWTRIDAVLDMYLLDMQLRKVEPGARTDASSSSGNSYKPSPVPDR